MISPFVAGLGALAAAGYAAYWWSPMMHDMNSTRALLKKESLDKYFSKKQEYSKIVAEIGALARHPEEATPATLARRLEELRLSPFYDQARCRSTYSNLWTLQAEKKDALPTSRLRRPKNRWCVLPGLCLAEGSLSCRQETECSKEELLLALYADLASDGK